MNVKNTIAHIATLNTFDEVKEVMDVEMTSEYPRKTVVTECKLRISEILLNYLETAPEDENTNTKEIAMNTNVLPEDEDTVEVPRPTVKVKSKSTNVDVKTAFLNFIEFPFKISDTTMSKLFIKERKDENGRVAVVQIEGAYYKTNSQRMYRLMGEIKRLAVNKGATTYFTKPPRDAAFLTIRW